MNLKKTILVSFMCIYGANIWSNPGSLDTSFGTDGLFSLTQLNQVTTATGVAVQDDGKLVMCGYNISNNNFMLARVDNDGILDTTFNSPLGYISSYIPSYNHGDRFAAVKIDADGKIVVVGQCTDSNSKKYMLTARYTSAGVLDTTFNGIGYIVQSFTPLSGSPTTQSSANSLSILDNGNILVGAWCLSSTGYTAGVIMEYLPDGTPNSSFGSSTYYSNSGMSTILPAGITTLTTQSMTLQSDGKILVCGIASATSPNMGCIVRLHTDGTIDTTFNGTGSVTFQFGTSWTLNNITQAAISNVIGIQVASNGNILVTGAASNNNAAVGSSADSSMFIARFTSSGILDTTFGTMPGYSLLYIRPTTTGYGLGIAPTNKITVVGGAGDSVASGTYVQNTFIARYNPDGSLDTTFDSEGYIVSTLRFRFIAFDPFGSSFGYEVPLQSDGKLLTVGNDLTYDRFAANRYLGGSIPFSPTLAIATYGLNSNYILNFLMVDFYAQSITDFDARAASIATLNTILADYAVDYVAQPNFNFISYLYLLENQFINAQADLIFIYPESTEQINAFFDYLYKQILTLNNL